METGDLPEDVFRFIATYIDTVPHLEALLLLFEDPNRRWTVDEIAESLYLPRRDGAQILRDLAVQGLAVAAAPELYTYDPGWDETGEGMKRVSATYRRQLIQVSSLIHSKASRGVREFARSFELKKK